MPEPSPISNLKILGGGAICTIQNIMSKLETRPVTPNFTPTPKQVVLWATFFASITYPVAETHTSEAFHSDRSLPLWGMRMLFQQQSIVVAG
jgi:hypothetical protein